MSRIPEEIIYTEILLRLPVKSLLKFKCVCKKWYALISTSDFVISHLQFTIHTRKPILMLESYEEEDGFYFIGYDSLESSVSEIEHSAIEIDFPFKSNLHDIVKLVGSYHGLVCIWVFENDDADDDDDADGREFLCVWNPATREYKKLPEAPIEIYGSSDQVPAICAFGYDHKTDDYKLAVGVAAPQSEDIVFQFYSLASNLWKPGPTLPYSFGFNGRWHGVVVNGYHHWLAIVKHQFFLLSLDVSDESFKEMQLPKELLGKNHEVVPIVLGVLEGCLCILGSSYVNGVKINVEVWEMLDYGVQESWTRRYIITHESIIKGYTVGLVALWSFENGQILFLNCGILVLYDPEHGSARELNNDESFSGTTANYFESLVSIESGTYAGEN